MSCSLAAMESTGGFCECQTNIKRQRVILVDLGCKTVEDLLMTVRAGEAVLEQEAEASSGRSMPPNFKSKWVCKYFNPENKNLGLNHSLFQTVDDKLHDDQACH